MSHGTGSLWLTGRADPNGNPVWFGKSLPLKSGSCHLLMLLRREGKIRAYGRHCGYRAVSLCTLMAYSTS